MKYYFLTYDRQQDFLDDRLYALLGEHPVVTQQAWAKAGGAQLGSATPPALLWGARPGHLLIDMNLRSQWVDRFGDDGVLATTVGTREMFLVVPDGDRECIAPLGSWQQYHYFTTELWPANDGRSNPKYSLAMRFEVTDPVVRPWDSSGALDTLYSAEVVSWLQSQGATGVSFSLVWDPDRTALPPVTEAHDHECIDL